MQYLKHKDIHWKVYQKMLVPDIPPHLQGDIVREDAYRALKQSNALLVRWTTEWDKEVKTNFWYVILDKPVGMSELSKNTRSKIRRGLNRCSVQKVTADYIANNAYKTYKNAFDNYKGPAKPLSNDTFKKEHLEVANNKEWEFWAVFEKQSNRLIAYSKNKIYDDYCEYVTIKFDPSYQGKHYPGEALFYTMNDYYLNETNVRYINDGARSLSHETDIQDYLIRKFNFRKAYCKLNIIYRKDVGCFVAMLLPLRNMIKMLNFKMAKNLQAILLQEKIARSFK